MFADRAQDNEDLEEVLSEDPKDAEEDLGTTDNVALGDEDPPVATPVTETAFSVLTAVQDGSIIVQPPYQRRAFWDRKKKASLIESVFLGLPLPLLYLADAHIEMDGEKAKVREVVDGQQRLSSLKDFYRGELTMPDDSLVADLQGKRYAELRPALKQTFKDFKLSTATIPQTAKADKFELFRRLNQQSTVLSDQELRNAAHHGEYLNLIKNEAERLKALLRVSDADWRRMKDVEFLTRLLAFERRGPMAFPNKRLNRFLNDEMDLGEAESHQDRERRVKRVEKALERCKRVFGDLRFRPYRIPEHGHDGEWARTVNRALMEVQVYALLDHSVYDFRDAAAFDKALAARRDEILEHAKRLHAYNERFNDTLQRGTSGKPNVEFRFERYRKMLHDALETVPNAERRRFFTLQQKQNLWDRLDPGDRTCLECGQPVTLDEAEVDHIKPFSKGGETSEGNGALLHRACNRAKGARWDPVEDPYVIPQPSRRRAGAGRR